MLISAHMYKELDTIVFANNIDTKGLKKGDVGTIVHIYEGNKAFEVEVVKADGNTVAVLTVKPDEIREMNSNEILSVRDLSPAHAG
jgi:ATP-dependent exoDNAse (exonuclease V) alpha subunit